MFWGQAAWDGSLVPPLADHVTLSKLLSLPRSQFLDQLPMVAMAPHRIVMSGE